MAEKLVRDKIPDMIRKNRETLCIRTAKKHERLPMLFKKLREECKELEQSKSIAEVTDVREVLDAICKELRYAPLEVDRFRREKVCQRGGFSRMIILKLPQKL